MKEVGLPKAPVAEIGDVAITLRFVIVRRRIPSLRLGPLLPSLPPAMLEEGTISFLPSQQELINAHIS